MRISKKLYKEIGELVTMDKKDEFKRERLRQRSGHVPISKPPNGIAGVDFSDYGDEGAFIHT